MTPEGETTLAGQAAPGDVVSFQLDGKEILTTTADASGNFVGLLTLPPSDAARMLSVVTKGADGVARAVDVAVAPVKGPVLAEVAATCYGCELLRKRLRQRLLRLWRRPLRRC